MSAGSWWQFLLQDRVRLGVDQAEFPGCDSRARVAPRRRDRRPRMLRRDWLVWWHGSATHAGRSARRAMRMPGHTRRKTMSGSARVRSDPRAGHAACCGNQGAVGQRSFVSPETVRRSTMGRRFRRIRGVQPLAKLSVRNPAHRRSGVLRRETPCRSSGLATLHGGVIYTPHDLAFPLVIASLTASPQFVAQWGRYTTSQVAK